MVDVKTIHIVGGPTAGGKSARAIVMAKEMDGVILNCDSRQIYEDLPILTAQPDADDLAQAPHALYGILHANDIMSAGRWRDLVLPEIEKTLDEGRTPIITGGNGLYIKALTEGMSPIPPVPEDIRKAAVTAQAEMGNPAFHAALALRDPETAALYHPMHTARLIHAWEVLEASGKPLVYWQSLPRKGPPAHWRFDITLVMPERAVLYERCNMRFEQMLARGAMDELNAFDARVAGGEIKPDSIMIKTVGASALRAWRSGEISREDAITLACTETRQYAKRQVTWFNNQIKQAENIAVNTIVSL